MNVLEEGQLVEEWPFGIVVNRLESLDHFSATNP